jgi:hypothetical protein
MTRVPRVPGLFTLLERMPDHLVRRCVKKERHTSEGAAQAALRSLLRRGLATDPARIHVYRCPHCDGWHTGH